jgi:hypothetical protein
MAAVVAGLDVAGVGAADVAAEVAADETGAHAVTIKARLTRRSIAVQGERRVMRRCVKVCRSCMLVFPF